MAEIRINGLANTAQTASNDDYVVLDGATNGTRKMLAKKLTEGVEQQLATTNQNVAQNTEDITDLKEDISQITGNEPILFGVGWYATAADGGTATYTNANTAVCAKVPVTEGEIVNVKGGALSSTQRLYVFENSEGKTFGRSLGNLNGEYKVTVPSGAVYMYINNILSVMPSGYYAYKGDPIKNVIPRVDTVEADIAGLQTDIAIISDGGKYEGNLMSGGLTSGYYSASGSITASNTLSHILVNVEGQTAVEVGGFLNTTTIDAWNVPAVFFDSGGGVVSVVPKQTSAPYKVDVPDGAVAIGINTGFKASEYQSSLPDGLYCAPFVGDPDKTFVKLSDLSDGDKKLKILTGIIRNDGTGWALLDNTDHEPINMASVELSNIGQIIVNYGFTAKKVLTLIAAPDETFAKQYRIGGSVDLGRATFNVYELPHEVGGQVHYNSTTGEWDVTYSTFDSVSFDPSTGAVTLTHPSVTGLLTKEKYNIHAQGRLCNVWAGRVTDTTITVYFLDASGNIIKNPTADLYAYVTRQVNTRLVDASTIVNASGNFWLYGVMEI